MKKKYGLKAVLASAMVSLALAAPAIVFSAPPAEVVGQIHFSGAELRSVELPSGEMSVQAIFDVSIDHVINATGASFHLEYNPDYLLPSDMTTNEVVKAPDPEAFCDDFFASDPELYYTEKDGKRTVVNPFERGDKDISQLDTGRCIIHMNLWLDQDSDKEGNGFITATGGPSGTTLADGTVIGGKVELLEGVNYGSTQADDNAYVVNCRQDQEEADDRSDEDQFVTLGQLSFQVNPEHLPEMLYYFNALKAQRHHPDDLSSTTPWVTTTSMNGPGTDTFLLDITSQIAETKDPWIIRHFRFVGNRGRKELVPLSPKDTPEAGVTTMIDSYAFDFDPKLIVNVEATEPEVTVNAYQNYTHGDPDDLPLTMGRYSPTVTVTYADGSKENIPFPWGQKDTAGAYKDGYAVKQVTGYYTQADVDAWTPPATDPTATCPFQVGDEKDYAPVTGANYDPTHGVYRFSQLYKWTDSKGKSHTFPKPVTAKLTVTPITVIAVTAEDKERSYKVTDVVDQVPDAASLRLPEEARIQTDIVPSGVSLTVPIKGWKPVQPQSAKVDPDGVPNSGDEYYQTVSTWPGTVDNTPGKRMNSLKADDYVLPGTYPAGDPDEGKNGYPYWPDSTDRSDTTTHPQRFLGRYSFETAQGDHATKENILSADIKALYPWLTIPFKPGSTTDRVEDWDVGQAYRSILDQEDFDKVDPQQYEVVWTSTVTEKTGNGEYAPNDHHPNGVDQPTLTLSVYKKTGASFSDYGSLAAGSVFRIWLPNGQELGTGQISGGVTVENWFNDSTDTDPITGPSHVNGYYYTTSDKRADASGDGLFFRLITNPDQPEVNEHGTQRETLRRYINLGGWYQVAVCEDPGAGNHWSEPIPVYVPPRRNEYIESKVYNFLGQNAGLYNWPGGVGDTLYLPRGDYAVVGPGGDVNTAGAGLPLYDVKDAATGNVLVTTDGTSVSADGAMVFAPGSIHRLQPNVEPHIESYGVKTIYDGQTGAQPGEIYTVRVDKTDTTHTDPWYATSTLPAGHTHGHVGGKPYYQYGPTPLYEGIDADADGVLDGFAVAGFGRVFQPETDPDKYTATLRREADEKSAQSVRIKLLSWEVDGITRNPVNSTDFDNDNVALVTYDTKQENYTSRQDFVLTIKNVGTTDIYGLDIDTVTDGYDLKDDGTGTRRMGGHFEMLVPPASFLPVGGTTTFTLTYVYDLPANEAPNTLLYRDTLYITANGHNDPGKGHQHDTGRMDDQYLLDFDAEFVVSKDPLHKVTVIYRPTNGNMGTANLIVGEQGTSSADVEMIYTPTTRTYAKDGLVYVVVNKVDEYAVKAITAQIDGVTVDLLNNNRYGSVTLPGLIGSATIDDDMKEVYVFQMPDHDVTVYVDFYEPFLSKLRLEDLIDFSSPQNTAENPNINDLKTSETSPHPLDPEHTYRVWRKTFTDAERDAATAWKNATSAADEDLYLMTQGTARPHNSDPKLEGQQFLSSENQYLVVIDAEDDLSQVEAKIRRVVYHEDYQGTNPANYPNGYNYEIELDVSMEVYPYNVEKQTGGSYNWGTSAYASEQVYAPNGTSPGYGPRPAFTGTPRTTVTGTTGYPPVDPSDPTATSDSSVHTSSQFISPAKGESKYVVITLSGIDPADPGGGTQYRYFYLEIHRKTGEPNVQLHYGNSPYGMIMNEDRFDTKLKQDAAKDAFRAGYTFEGLSRTVVPDAVWDHSDMHHVIYNREAWVRNRAVFEPESLTGFRAVRRDDGSQVFLDEDPSDPDNPNNPLNIKTKPKYEPNKTVYDEKENLDLNEYAYFAILGETLREPGVVKAWDSSGRQVPLDRITAKAMDIDWATNSRGLTLLDTAQQKQVARFKGNTTDFPVLDLGVQGRTLTFLAEHQPAAPATPLTVTKDHWPASSQEVTTTPATGGEPVTTTEYTLIEDIRPGRYTIVYSFKDFDGTTELQVERPFVILRGVGDVNTDGKRDSVKTAGATASDSDEYHIEDRVGVDPLGYEAGGAVDASNLYGKDYPFANIFKFRVCDVNNDRNINNIDANQLDKNARAGTGWLRFYHPWEYGLS